MKIKTKKKLENFKIKIEEYWYVFLRFILKPISKPYLFLYDRKWNKIRDGNKYKIKRIEKELYKSIQNRLVNEEVIYVFDVGYISEWDEDYNFLIVNDLFTKLNNKYLKRYYYYAKPKILKTNDIWCMIKSFDSNDVKVTEMTQEELKEDLSDWKYIEYSQLYRNMKKVLKISINEEDEQ